MAEPSIKDVVNQAQSMDDSSSVGVSGRTLTSDYAGQEEVGLSSELGAKTTDTNTHATITSNQHQHISTKQDLPSDSLLVNGQSKNTEVDEPGNHLSHLNEEHAVANGTDTASYNGSEDNNYQASIGNEGSNGSDLDGTRNEGHDGESIEGSWRQRSASIARRTTGFKSVSVTKNYLAKTGVSTPMNGKAMNERVVTSSQPYVAASAGPKPRLVAKLGKDSRTTALGSPSTTSGPDASKVWNRNRPIAPPPPKQFTDEELKQQYGIHMATRLQADEAGKDGKWADIDDDEDDWAPEAIQWVDGTRSSVVAPELQPKPVQAGTRSTAKDGTDSLETQQLQPQSQSHSQTPPPSSVSSIGKTILKPGTRLNLQTKPGLVLRSVPETPAPATKPAQSSSTRSPWATLPPVDKASPIAFVPPVEPTASLSFAQRDSSAIDDAAAIPSPTKEIAADDFDRSWRDNERGGQALFNSQSGRYEPVKTARRASRNESGFRPPAVLQRPGASQGPGGSDIDVGGSSAPAPSGMFHNNNNNNNNNNTNNYGAQAWSRRTESSFNNPSIDQGPTKGLQPLPIDSATPPYSFSDAQDKRTSSASPAPPPPPHSSSPASVEPDAHQPYSAHSSNNSDVDPRTAQQQVMRQKIAANRKRKQEEEAKEEAARKERIRLKLAALETEASKPSNEGPVSETAIPSEETARDTSASRDGPNESGSHSAASAATATQGTQASTSPLPTKSSLSQHLSADKASVPTLQPTSVSKTQSSPTISTSPAIQPPVKPASDSIAPSSKTPELKHLPGLGQPPALGPDRLQPSWNRNVQSTTDNSGAWSNRTTHSGNLWGPPTTDRGIGNGVFDNNINHIPSINIPLSRQIPSPVRPQYSPAFMSPHPTPSPPLAGPPSYDENSGRSRQPFASQPAGSETGHRLPREPRDQAKAMQAWRDFSINPEIHDAKIDEANREFTAMLAAKRQQNQGYQHAIPHQTIHESFTQISAGDTVGSRRAINTKLIIHDDVNSTIVDSGQLPVQYSIATGHQVPPLHQFPNGRASRFFGPGVDRGQPIHVIKHIDQGEDSTRSDSPPPPDNFCHPAFTDPSHHPHVRLPVAKPKVKLPPLPMEPVTETSQQLEPVTMPTRPPVRGQPIVQSSDWQARFNGLFGRKEVPKPQNSPAMPVTEHINTSPAKQQSAPITSASKSAYDVSTMANTATVSLPVTAEPATPVTLPPSLGEDRMETKLTEEDLMDDREFGSSPTVRIYKGTHPRYQQIFAPTPISKYENESMVAEKAWPLFEKTIARPLSFHWLDSDLVRGSQHTLLIHIPGQPKRTAVMDRQSSTIDKTFHKQFRGDSSFNSKKKAYPRKVSSTVGTPSAQSSNSGTKTTNGVLPKLNRSAKGNIPDSRQAASSSSSDPVQKRSHDSPTEPGKQTQQQQARRSSSQWGKAPRGLKKPATPQSRQQPLIS